MGETPFRLIYGSEAIIPVVVGEMTWRIAHPNPPGVNELAVREELDLVEETHDLVTL